MTANFGSQSEMLAEMCVIIFMKRIPPWQNDTFALLKLLFIADKKQKLCRFTIVNQH